jgi:glutathione S-transferase
MLTLWGGATSRTLRAHWMLHELGIDYEPRLIGSRTGATQTDEFQGLNPKEKIPVLVDGDLVLTESVAIVTYLGDTYGPDSGLIPAPYSVERARYNEWSSFVQMELDAHTLYVLRKHRDLADIYGEAPAAVQTAIEGFNKQVAVAEDALAVRDYLLGSAFTAADLILMTCLDWADVYGIELSTGFDDYRARIHGRPAFKSAAKLNFSIAAGA